jgi:Bifunctional DNA primase/polymerase, N-terminal
VSFDDRELAGIACVMREFDSQIIGIFDLQPGNPDRTEMAMEYAGRGWHVFPLHTPDERGCSCRHDCPSPGKHPRTIHGLHDATTDPHQIELWWRMWPTANIGIATGAASGLVVIDIDPRNGGDESMLALETIIGPLSGTVTANTGGGGTHLYYAHPANPRWPTPSRGAAFGAELPGIDVKADGGYVVAPPSSHTSGRNYTWVGPWAHQLTGWPLSLMWRHAPPPRPAPRRGGPGGTWGGSSCPPAQASATPALAGASALVANAQPGNRNNALNWAAWHMGMRVALGHLELAQVWSELGDAASRAGLQAREIALTLTSATRSAFTAAGI